MVICMNNKKTGTDFENRVCDYLSGKGYWVHFIVPDARGAQPFDVIAVKDGEAYAIDCKTCVANVFTINRLEENQIMAFQKWIRCGNFNAVIAIEHCEEMMCVDYMDLMYYKKVRLGGKKSESKTDDCCECVPFDDFFS